jgi:hypothetical protein
VLQTCAERAYDVHLLPSTWLLSAIRVVESYYLTTPELPSDLECMETHWLVGLGWDLELGHGSFKYQCVIKSPEALKVFTFLN